MRLNCRNRLTGLGLMLAAMAVPLTATPLQAAPAGQSLRCDRDCLKGFATSYMDAMRRHDLSGVPLAKDAVITENLVPVRAGEGIVRHIQAIRYPRQFVIDAAKGEVGVQAVVEDLVGEAVLALRLKVADGTITEVETLLTHDGEGGPAFLPAGFLLREGPYIREIPAPVRTGRDDLLMIARKYWTSATSTHAREDVPYDLNCLHIENGMNTDWEHFLDDEAMKVPGFAAQADGRRFTCATDLMLSTTFFTGLSDYRTLVDEDLGLVMVWNIVDTNFDRAPFPPATSPSAAAEDFARRLADPRTKFGPDDVPPGLTMRGMVGTPGVPRRIYHAETMLIIGGKIVRHQQFLHDIGQGITSPWAAR